MAEQTQVEDTAPALGQPRAPSPALQRWGRVLAEALDASGSERWGTPAGADLAQALVVYVEGPEDEAAALHLDRRCATAVVTRLLRRGSGLERRSGPEQVRRVVADYLAETATRLVGKPMRAHLGPSLRSFSELVPLWLDTREDAALGAGVRVTRDDGGEALAGLQLELPLVVAAGHGARSELDTLLPGDVWLPESGWFITPDALAGAVAKSAETSCGARLQRGARLGLPGTGQAAVVSVQGTHVLWSGKWAPEQDTDTTQMQGADLVFVQITAGSVRLPLRRWSALAQGDALERQASDLWTLVVDGDARGFGVPHRWEEAWGLKLTLILPRSETLAP